MKGLNVTSARATEALRPTGQSSVRHPHTLTSAEFALTGPSDLPDPQFNAYRKDLADVALAGRVIASHYAKPVERRLRTETNLQASPSEASTATLKLCCGDLFLMLDDSMGWAWGYAGEEGRVGYVPSGVLGSVKI